MNQVQYQGEWSFVVKKSFVTDPKLSVGARLLYILLKSYCSPNGHTAFPSSAKVAAQLGVTKDTVNKWARELEASKWLSRSQIDNETGRFTHTLWTIYGSNLWEKHRRVVFPPRLDSPLILNSKSNSKQALKAYRPWY